MDKSFTFFLMKLFFFGSKNKSRCRTAFLVFFFMGKTKILRIYTSVLNALARTKGNYCNDSGGCGTELTLLFNVLQFGRNCGQPTSFRSLCFLIDVVTTDVATMLNCSIVFFL